MLGVPLQQQIPEAGEALYRAVLARLDRVIIARFPVRHFLAAARDGERGYLNQSQPGPGVCGVYLEERHSLSLHLEHFHSLK